MEPNSNETARTESARLSLVLEIAELGYWDFDPNIQILNWSGRAKTFFGLNPDDEMTYEMFLGSVHYEDRERTHQAIQAALNQEIGSYAVEFRAIGIRDGVERTIVARGTVLFGENGPTRIVGVSSDVTEIRRRVRELEVSRANAETANQAKTQFLANMSHEIRTPLATILGYADLALREENNSDEHAEFLRTIHRNGELLLKLINEVLDLSKIEENKIEIKPSYFNFETSLMQIVAALRPQAEKKGLKLNLFSHGAVPESVESDPMRFQQILFNLIGNAIKFTPHGEIDVIPGVVPPLLPGKRMTIRVAVRDSGIGINPEQREKLFKRFSQIDNSDTRAYGGSGLGLVLSKNLAMAMGGDLILEESTEGRGSTFVFLFPDSIYNDGQKFVSFDSRHQKHEKHVENAPALVTGPSEVPDLRGVNVLIVDDSADNQKMLSHFLELAGASVDFAANGLDAIDKIDQAPTRYDVVLMDIQMPVLDGATATKRLREQGYRRPIIALTANAMPSHKHRSREIGFDDHLVKPISSSKLLKDVFNFSRKPVQPYGNGAATKQI